MLRKRGLFPASLGLPHPRLMILCLKLPSVLSGWRQCSQGWRGVSWGSQSQRARKETQHMKPTPAAASSGLLHLLRRGEGIISSELLDQNQLSWSYEFEQWGFVTWRWEMGQQPDRLCRRQVGSLPTCASGHNCTGTLTQLNTPTLSTFCAERNCGHNLSQKEGDLSYFLSSPKACPHHAHGNLGVHGLLVSAPDSPGSLPVTSLLHTGHAALHGTPACLPTFPVHRHHQLRSSGFVGPVGFPQGWDCGRSAALSHP